MQQPTTTIYYQNTPEMSRWRNHPQSSSMTAATLIFISCGMMMAQGMGWNIDTIVQTTSELQYCWSIAAMIGAACASPLTRILRKRFYMIISGALVLASGIMFVSTPYDYDVIISARCINGFAFGFTAVPFIIHGSEVAARNYRGYVLSMGMVGFNIGIMTQIIYDSQWTIYDSFAANTVQGIAAITFGALALICTFMMIESPIFFLRRGNDEAAQDCQRRLVRPELVTTETMAFMEEHRAYIVENKTSHPFAVIGPLIKIILFNSVLALATSIPMNNAIIQASYVSIGYQYSWPPVVYGFMRFFGACIAMPIIDGLGRKLLSLISLFFMMVMIFSIGGIYSWTPNALNGYEMSIVCSLAVIFQFFAGLYAPASAVYMGEAFPMFLKPYAIAAAIVVQQAIYIAITNAFVFTAYNMYVYCITAGCIMLALLVVFAAMLPETRNTTLRDARHRFSPLLFLRQY